MTRSFESKFADVSNSIDQPPTAGPVVAKFHDNWGVSLGAGLTPESMDHEPLSGDCGTGSAGRASEPGTYTNEISGLLTGFALFG